MGKGARQVRSAVFRGQGEDKMAFRLQRRRECVQRTGPGRGHTTAQRGILVFKICWAKRQA